MALDSAAVSVSALGALPYDAMQHAIASAEGCIQGSAADYAMIYTYNQQTQTAVYTLYVGVCSRSGDTLSFTSGVVYDFKYTTTSTPVSATQSVSGSFSGQAVGQSPAVLNGSFSGSVPVVQYQYTIAYDCDITPITAAVGVDTTALLYGSMDDLPHLERGYSYADIGRAAFVPVCVGALLSVFLTQIFRKFG